MYVGKNVEGLVIGEYNAIELAPPFSPKNYLEAIQVAEDAGVEFLIVDSLTHAWTGEGGMLEIQGNVAERTKNSYTAWREVTPLHNRLIDKILQCNMHVIISLRSKVEYVLEDGHNGKKTPVKKGMSPIFRDGVEYECTTFFEIAQNHVATTSKDRTGLFDNEFFTITPKTGERIWGWLAGGASSNEPAPSIKKAKPEQVKAEQAKPEAEPEEDLSALGTDTESGQVKITAEKVDKAIKAYCAGMDKAEKLKIAAEIKAITGGIINCLQITDADILALLYQKFGK